MSVRRRVCSLPNKAVCRPPNGHLRAGRTSWLTVDGTPAALVRPGRPLVLCSGPEAETTAARGAVASLPDEPLAAVRAVAALGAELGGFTEVSGSSEAESEDCLVCREALGAGGQPVRCDACGRAFHSECLSRWLRSVPGSRRAFGSVLGPCPLCKARIACRA